MDPCQSFRSKSWLYGYSVCSWPVACFCGHTVKLHDPLAWAGSEFSEDVGSAWHGRFVGSEAVAAGAGVAMRDR